MTAKPTALDILRAAPEGDGYSMEDLMWLTGWDAASTIAELSRLDKRGSAVEREGVWYATTGDSKRPAPAKSKGLRHPPDTDITIGDEIAEAEQAVALWSAHLRALRAYRESQKRSRNHA